MRDKPLTIVRIEYSLDSLGDIPPSDFERECESVAEQIGCCCQFIVGLHNRETIDGEPCDRITERAFAACCSN